MDLGLGGRTAIVCGSSSGLGYACAEALAAEGAQVVLVSRDERRLAAAAARLKQATGVAATFVACDVGTEAGRAAILDACPAPDILVNNAGGPAKKDFRAVSLADWKSALDLNFLASVELIRQVVDGMGERGWGRIVNITSLTARMPIEQLDQSTAARLALVGYVAGVARQVAATGVTINNLLPGAFATERLKAVGDAGNALTARVPMKRAGEPPEFGAVCAFLCSTQAAYLTGQNVLLDGGLVPITV